MKTERIAAENTDPDYGKSRHGAIRDLASKQRSHAQGGVAVEEELASNRERPRPASLQLQARSFQLELYKRAKAGNTIAVLDTGSGKTLIAALLVKDAYYAELQDTERKRKKLVFFLVDKVALAMQQAEFLQRTCPGRIGLLYGALGVDNFSPQQWEDVFDAHDVVVMTADILKDCLARKLIFMQNISLLIFDECHHATKGHAYALVQRFYHATPSAQRPKIFAMTASPVGSQKRPELIARELEQTLDAKICTLNSHSELSQFSARPKEFFCLYDAVVEEHKSNLSPSMLAVQTMMYTTRTLHKGLKKAAEAAENLGDWAAYILVQLLLKDLDWRAQANTTSKRSRNIENQKFDAELVEEHLGHLQAPTLETAESTMTAKVRKFLALITSIYKDASLKQLPVPVVLVFCERRTTAYCLMVLCNGLLAHTLPAQMKCSLFIGHGSTDEGDISMSAQRQGLVVDHFKRNDVNCLFATSVAEEGIDIPACEMVIRFDPLTNVTQYIQSRGRARKPDSCYVTMMARDDARGIADHKYITGSESIVKDVYQSLPDDRRIGIELEDDNSVENDSNLFDARTGLPGFSAMNVVDDYCRSLPADEFVLVAPSYEVLPVAEGCFIATCIFPPVAEIPPVVGTVQRGKRSAKVSAAQSAVAEIRARGLLNEYFRPVLPELSDTLEDELGLPNSWANLPCRHPSFWQKGVAAVHYLTRISTDKSDGDYANLLLVTKGVALPPFSPLSFSHKNSPFTMTCTNLSGSITLTDAQLDILVGFTGRLWKVMVNRDFSGTKAQYPYFLAIDTGSNECSDAIDWPQMEKSYVECHEPITSLCLRTGLQNRIVKDSYGHYYYYVQKIRWDLSPSSLAVKSQNISRGTSVVETQASEAGKPSQYRSLHNLAVGQPLLQVKQLKRVLNYLGDTSERDSKETDDGGEPTTKNLYLVPESSILVNMTASIVATAFLMPSLFTRIDSLLCAQELNELLGTSITTSVLAEAITTRQALHGIDYERYEYLGDAYLKLITTVAVYLEYPGYHEGLLTMYRTVILENKNLRKLAMKLKLYEIIRSEPLAKKSWTPPFVLERGFEPVPKLRKLSNKQLADVVEAILGAALWDGGFDAALKAATALGIETYGIRSWNDAREKCRATLPKFLSKRRYVPGLDEVEKLFQYTFDKPGYVEQALRHGSCPMDPKDPVPSYQRLEFIGDAVLEIEVALWLFHNFPRYNPNRLTLMKSHLVRNKSLGSLMESTGLHRHMRYFSSTIPGAIAAFTMELAFLKERAFKSDYYSDCDPPKFMSDMLEALIGAIFLDNDLRTDPVKKVFQSLFLSRLDPDIDYSTKRPAMGILAGLLQQSGCQEILLSRTEEVDHFRLDHRLVQKNLQPKRTITLKLKVHQEIICTVEARSTGLAKLKLAESALMLLTTERPKLLKQLCTCVKPTKVPEVQSDTPEFTF